MTHSYERLCTTCRVFELSSKVQRASHPWDVRHILGIVFVTTKYLIKKSTWGRRIFFWFIVGCCKTCRGREGMVVDDSMIVGVFNDAPPPDLLK